MREISPLDGRYAQTVGALGSYFSEHALAEARCEVELRYLLALDETEVLPRLSRDERDRIGAAIGCLSDAEFARIREIERDTQHDVKACEMFLREKLALAHPEALHFGLTSEDVTNLAYGLILSRYRDREQLPQLRRLVARLTDEAERWAASPFPARTHGQAASPTTYGKELAVFVSRLVRQGKALECLDFCGKFSGATGTCAAWVAAAPGIDWLAFSEAFIASLGLEPEPCATQIDDGDKLAEYFSIVQRLNGILIDLDVDLWEYISRGDLAQAARAGEVGSSTMPHKVNPIHFENSEGNAALSTALLGALSAKLTQSRMQRDLSNSTVKRSIGVALAHAFLAVEQTMNGLSRVTLAEDAARRHVDEAPETLAEAYQTILRAAGVGDAYETLRELARGRRVDLAALRAWIESLNVAPAVKARLAALEPADYLGRAAEIARRAAADARSWLGR
ncbi:MAG: adenylosuccinate lyase [Candidatus Bipolaricaulota bacterium]